MKGLPAALEHDLLYVFVLGPGFGETILVRIPPDRWLIVDSFICARTAAAEKLVDLYKGTVDTVVLTHPHADHHAGILELIERFPQAVLGSVYPPRQPTAPGLPNDPAKALKQRAKITYDRIWSEWEKSPEKKWETFRARQRQIGDGQVVSLHPDIDVAHSNWAAAPNDFSSALRVTWGQVSILLGADIPKSYWSSIAADFPDLGNHHLLKVPHHGSKEAFADAFGNGDASRCWVVTPFNKNGLPRPADDDGIARALGYVETLHVTSLPYRHSHESGSPCDTTRLQLRDGTHPTNTGLLMQGLLDTPEALDRHVVAAYSREGELRLLLHGPGSVRVTREPVTP